MTKTMIRTSLAALLSLTLHSVGVTSLIGTSFDVTLNGFVETTGTPGFGIEQHNGTQNFDGLVESLLNTNNVQGAQGKDLLVTDIVTATGPTSESVSICITAPDGGTLFNGNLNTASNPDMTVFNVSNVAWGAGAGPATVSNVA